MFVIPGKAKVKQIPLIIPRRYMSSESFREVKFDFAGVFCCGCWFCIGGCWFGMRVGGGVRGVGFGVGVLISSDIFLLLMRGAGVVKCFLLN